MESQSVFIFLVPVFGHSLPVMALLTQAPPVALVPEQFWITAMRGDVVNHCRFHIPRRLFLHAQHTQRVRLQIFPAGFLPLPSVPSLGGRSHFLRMKRFVLLTILLTVRDESCTAGMSARCVWSVWHLFHLRFFVLCLYFFHSPLDI